MTTIPIRPRRSSPEIKEMAARKLVANNWDGFESYINSGDTQEDVVQEILSATKYGAEDGYEIAKELDGNGWTPDSGLVDLLEGYCHHLWEAENEAQRAWASTVQGMPAELPKGTRVKLIGRTLKGRMGKIMYTDSHGVFKYIIQVDGQNYPNDTGGNVIAFEDVEAA